MNTEHRLHVVSSIRPGCKLFVSDPENPYVSTNGFGMARFIWKETRESTLRYLIALAAECETYASEIRPSSVENAIAGLENLKETYASDRTMCIGITSVQSRLLDVLAQFSPDREPRRSELDSESEHEAGEKETRDGHAVTTTVALHRHGRHRKRMNRKMAKLR